MPAASRKLRLNQRCYPGWLDDRRPADRKTLRCRSMLGYRPKTLRASALASAAVRRNSV